jgi:hypothetical protein
MHKKSQFLAEQERQYEIWKRRGLTPEEALTTANAVVDIKAMEYRQQTQGLGDADACLLEAAYRYVGQMHELAAQRIEAQARQQVAADRVAADKQGGLL